MVSYTSPSWALASGEVTPDTPRQRSPTLAGPRRSTYLCPFADAQHALQTPCRRDFRGCIHHIHSNREEALKEQQTEAEEKHHQTIVMLSHILQEKFEKEKDKIRMPA